MIQCKDCELCETGPGGRKIFKCDPFVNVKEPECLTKWQLLKLDMLLSGYRTMVGMQQKMAPVQDRIMKYVQRELDDMEDADSWKFDTPDEPDDDLL